MSPELGGNRLVIRLNKVVLPAPFGPISAVRLPSETSSVTSETAATPPNLLLTLTTLSAALIRYLPSTARGRASEAVHAGTLAARASRRANRRCPPVGIETPRRGARLRPVACKARRVGRFPAEASAGRHRRGSPQGSLPLR